MPRTPSYMIDQEKLNTIKSSILAGGRVCSSRIKVVTTPSASSGDMQKVIYDTNGNGVVDNAELVNGLTVLTAVPSGAVFTDTMYNDSNVLKDSDTLSPVTDTNKLLTEADGGGSGSGDMNKNVYDQNDNGTVDDSELVNGLTVQTAVPVGAKFTDTIYNDSTLNSHLINYYNPHQVNKTDVGLGVADNTSDLDKPISDDTQDALDAIESDIGDLTTDDVVEASNLYYTDNRADLRVQDAIDDDNINTDSLYSSSKIEDLLYGALVYKGEWDAYANNPGIIDGTGKFGWFYEVTVAGTQDLGSGNITFDVGDRAAYDGMRWTRCDANSTIWGQIVGDITDQTDLQDALELKADDSDISNLENIISNLNTDDIAEASNLYYTYGRADSRVQAAIQDDTISLTSLYSSSKIEALIEGSLVYVGMWDASTNTPTLSDGTGTDGFFYSVSVAGTQDLGSGDIDFIIGDRVVYNGTIWQQSAATDTANWGEIYGDILNQTDLQTALGLKTDDTAFDAHLADVANPHVVTQTQVGLSNVDNTTDLNKPISTATQTALDLKAEDSNLTAHIGNTFNPHEVSSTQVGLGSVDDTADIDKPISTLQQAEIDMKVEWKDKWVNATYYENDMVLDSPYTMIANKETTDKAGIEYVGSPYFIYTGTLTDHQITAKQVIFGNRYTASTLIQLTGFRISVVTGMSYSIFLITNPSTEPIVKQVGNKFIADSTGWINIDSTGTLVGGGLVFDLVAYVHEPAVSPTITTLNYNYTTPNNAGTPGNGEALQANRDLSNLKFHNTDDDGNNNDVFLNGLTPGDIITTGAMVWTVQSIVDEGITVTYGVSPATQYGTEGVIAFEFETVVATPITAGREVDANLATSTSGLYIADGAYADIVPDDNQYGLDVYVQEVSKSDDWDLVAMSGNAVGGGDDGGTTIEIVDNLTTQDSSKALSANQGYVLDNAKVANGRVLTDVPSGAVFIDTVYDDSTIQGEVDLNTAKVGITTQQAADITTNNGKVTDLVHPLVETAVPVGAVFTDTPTDITSKMDKDDAILTGSFTEEVYANSGTALEPDNGTIQTQAITGNINFTDGLSSGQSMTLILLNGSSYTVGYPAITWSGGVPTLTDSDTLVFWKVSTTLYGTLVGSNA